MAITVSTGLSSFETNVVDGGSRANGRAHLEIITRGDFLLVGVGYLECKFEQIGEVKAGEIAFDAARTTELAGCNPQRSDKRL